MKQVKLGKTGLEVSVAGLGSGGSSRLGQGYGFSKADSTSKEDGKHERFGWYDPRNGKSYEGSGY